MHKVSVKAFWLQSEVGLMGYIGAVLSTGIPVALCSKEKWDLGSYDSLRKNWNGRIKLFNKPKTFYYVLSEEELVEDGLLKGSPLEMKVPVELVQYLSAT